MASIDLTASRLRELLHYDPDTGEFFKRFGDFGIPLGADRSRKTRDRPYLTVSVGGASYRAHRLAWLYVTGAWPVFVIDHIDGNPANNRFSNLRDVTPAVNSQNKYKCSKNNKSTGLLGVTKHRGGKFQARISSPGINNAYLGSFDTAEEAHAAYVTAKRKIHPGGML